MNFNFIVPSVFSSSKWSFLSQSFVYFLLHSCVPITHLKTTNLYISWLLPVGHTNPKNCSKFWGSHTGEYPDYKSCGMWHHKMWQVVTTLTEEPTTPIKDLTPTYHATWCPTTKFFTTDHAYCKPCSSFLTIKFPFYFTLRWLKRLLLTFNKLQNSLSNKWKEIMIR